MKKLLLLFTLLLTSCDSYYSETDDREIIFGNLEIICRHSEGNSGINYYRDIDTDLIYMQYYVAAGTSLSIYYNSDGNPMNYDEFKTIHINKN